VLGEGNPVVRVKSLLFVSLIGVSAWWLIKHHGLRLESVIPKWEEQPTRSVHMPPPPPARRLGDTIRVATACLYPSDSMAAVRTESLTPWLAALIGRFDILAFQQIGLAPGSWLADAVRRASESGRQYDFLIVDQREPQHGEGQTFAVVFDAASVQIDRPASHCVRDPHALLAHPPLVCPFRVRGVEESQAFTFTLVSVHVDVSEVQREMATLADVYREVRRSSGGEDDIILVGNFPNHVEMGQLEASARLHSPVATIRESDAGSGEHFLLRLDSTSEFTGRASLMTPAEWGNGLETTAASVLVCPPVWAEFTVHEQLARRPVAGRPELGGAY
jgi:hypothetical protein